MLIRLAYLKRNADGTVQPDGIELDPAFDIDDLPRIGEGVWLPRHIAQKAHPDFKSPLLPRRFEVVQIDHFWDRLMAPTRCVYVADVPGWHLPDEENQDPPIEK